MAIEKRWFLRRAVAFVIDWLVVSFGVLLVVFAIQIVTGTPFKTTEIITFTSCRNIDVVSEETLQAIGSELPNAQHFQKVCKFSNLGLVYYYRTTIGAQTSSDGATQTRTIGYISDSEGNPTAAIPLPVDWLVPVLAPLFFAFQVSREKSTYGKLIMSLEVVTLEGSTPAMRATLRREFLKFSPMIILPLHELASSFFMQVGQDLENPTVAQIVEEMIPLIPDSPGGSLDQLNLSAWFTFGNLLALAAVMFYLTSFVRWRGQTYWDQFAKLKVTSVWENTQTRAS